MTIHEAYAGMRAYFTVDGAVIARSEVSGMCRYRTHEGNKCAVGCLIPDDQYERKFDSNDQPSLPDIVSEVWPEHHGEERLISFLAQAQNRHDNSQTAGEFVRRLDELAATFGLEVLA